MPSESEDLVTRRDRGPIVHLSLNRPQYGNSLSLATIDALHQRLHELRTEKTIGVIVLSGVGQKIFCAGHDLRPQYGNSLSLATIDALHQRLHELRTEKTIGVIVLSGVGQKIFCAGHDLKEFGDETDPEFFHTVSIRCSAMMQALQDQPQIVIARVAGVASAAGCQLV